jgi:ASC-1-like (ASCH) protein
MIHKSHLNTIPFEKIKNGSKSVELRLRDEKRSLYKVGDKILFKNRETSEELVCKIIGLCWFDNFGTLVKNFGALKCGWDKEYDAEQYNTDMEQYYQKSEIEKYGVLGIVLYIL